MACADPGGASFVIVIEPPALETAAAPARQCGDSLQYVGRHQ
jgi:hypothetical protein